MEKEMLKKEAKKPLSPSWHSTSYTQLSRKQVNRPRSLFTHEIRFMVLFIILSYLVFFHPEYQVFYVAYQVLIPESSDINI